MTSDAAREAGARIRVALETMRDWPWPEVLDGTFEIDGGCYAMIRAVMLDLPTLLAERDALRSERDRLREQSDFWKAGYDDTRAELEKAEAELGALKRKHKTVMGWLIEADTKEKGDLIQQRDEAEAALLAVADSSARLHSTPLAILQAMNTPAAYAVLARARQRAAEGRRADG